MARGLSDLQVFILKEAATRGAVFARDIKARYYGWQTSVGLFDGDYERLVANPRHLLQYKGGGLFSRDEIGAAKFNSVSVAISKAITRLSERGFLKYYWLGIECDPPQADYVPCYSYEGGFVLTDVGEKYVRVKFRIEAVEKPWLDDVKGRGHIGYWLYIRHAGVRLPNNSNG